MKRRVVLWAIIGLFVGCVWVAYAFATGPDVEVQLSVLDRVIRTLAYITCPIIAAGTRFYWVPLDNAASYAVLGLALELIWKKSTHYRISRRTHRHFRSDCDRLSRDDEK
jgi:hypothetical protein